MFPPKFPNNSQSKGHDFFLSAAIFRYNRMLEKVQGPTARNESLEGVVTKASTVATRYIAYVANVTRMVLHVKIGCLFLKTGYSKLKPSPCFSLVSDYKNRLLMHSI